MISLSRSGALGYLVRRIGFALRPVPRLWSAVETALRDRDGIEIAGPTRAFDADGPLPVYPVIRSLENYGFHASDQTFEFSGRIGRSHRCDATSLPRGDESCDFVLSSHVLEHLADPLRALREWRRVLRPGGHLFLLLPHGARTFDHRRPVTEWSHLMADFEGQTPETDRTHVDDCLRLTDTNHWSFVSSEDVHSLFDTNVESRNVHHHVFDLALAQKAVAFAGFRILTAQLVFPFHIVVFAVK